MIRLVALALFALLASLTAPASRANDRGHIVVRPMVPGLSPLQPQQFVHRPSFNPFGGQRLRERTPFATPFSRPIIVCDQFGGGCFRTPNAFGKVVIVPRGDNRFQGFQRFLSPPAFSASDRFARLSPEVVCDRGSSICYKNGHIDKTETEAAFGNDASRDADRLRDRAGSDVFVPFPGVICSQITGNCTRKHF